MGQITTGHLGFDSESCEQPPEGFLRGNVMS